MNVKEGNHGSWNGLGMDLGCAVMSGLQFATDMMVVNRNG